jgi:putative component of membrane protein insertase Oxa1/YidC/SpoIIIJ protein YidD
MEVRIRTVLIAAATVATCAAALALDPQAAALRGIHAYQHAVAPIAARLGVRCRMTPTCSRYAEIVIARDGVVRGGLSAVRRLMRCGPWTTAGTRDDP